MAADLTKSIPHLLEDLFLNAGIKDLIIDAALSVTVPTVADAESDLVDVTVTGVALGDAVLVANPTEALPTDAIFSGAYVSATDTVTFAFDTKEGGTGITGAAKTFVLIVADRT